MVQNRQNVKAITISRICEKSQFLSNEAQTKLKTRFNA